MNYFTAGESHGSKLIVIIDDVPSGIALSEDDINFELKRRSNVYGRSSRQKQESNSCKIISGVNNGRTTANPISVEIENSFEVQDTNDFLVRPGHADLNGVIKYNFDSCKNVSERASARETAARIVAGVIAKNMLCEFGVEVYGYVCSIGSVKINISNTNMLNELPLMSDIAISKVMCPDVSATKKMIKQIDRAQENNDSLGGKFCICATGLVAGLGSYCQGYNRLDSKISAAIMSVPSVKGVLIGNASYMSENVGSASLDQITKDENNNITRTTNYSGGIEGGLTNGMPLFAQGIVKPIPSIKKEVKTIDLETMEAVDNITDKRSDVCVVPSACVVAENEVAVVLANVYQDKFGRDCIMDMKLSLDSYKQRIKSLS